MESIKFVFLCLVLIKSCLAVENQTMDLEQQLKIQKREKQYLIEDEPFDGLEQKREERQSVPDKTNQVEPKVQSKTVNIRVQPKRLPTSLKPTLKTILMQKPANYHGDTTPQQIPTKIPVILKTTKVVPNAAHALRVKMMENMKNNSILNKELDLNTNHDNISVKNNVDPLSKDNIPFTIEDKDLNTENCESPNKENKGLHQENKVNLNKENRGFLSFKNGEVNLGTDEDKKDYVSSAKEEVDLAANLDPPIDIKRRCNFFIDEAEPISSTIVNKSAKNKITSSRQVDNQSQKDDFQQEDLITNDEQKSDDGPDIVKILNGTHIISIQKIRDHVKDELQKLLSREDSEETEPQIDHIHTKINKKSPKPLNELEKSPTHRKQFDDSKIKEDKNKKQSIEMKDPTDYITIINHDYEEIEEKSPLLPAVSTNIQEDGSLPSWNYPQTHQNLYYNPYCQNIYDQYRWYYDVTQNKPNVQFQEIDNSYTVDLEYSPSYNENENQPIYSNNYFPNEPEFDNSCQEIQPETTLDRNWRAWKDVEIKIRNSQNNEEPIDIDIRRNMVDSSNKVSNNGIGKLPYPYVNQPNVLNGYYNNKNSALYPFVNRYVQ